MVLQERDLATLEVVRTYRYLKAHHVKSLLFPGVSLRVAQRRLRKLWEYQYLERHYVPFVLDGEHPSPRGAGEPIYTVGKQGIESRHDDGSSSTEHNDERRPVSLLTLSHHLVAVDFLVALTVAVRSLPELVLEAIEPEWTLWRKVAALKENRRYRPGFLVSDGAFTLRYRPLDTGVSYHLEVVRAGVKGGNDTILKKLRRYTELQHQGFFRAVFGQEHLRAIVFVTPTAERAQHLRQLAGTLPYGQQLFWFGSYEEPHASGPRVSSLTPSTILEHRWCSAGGQFHSFIPTGASGAGA